MENKIEKLKNEKFEKDNPGFCKQFRKDAEERAVSKRIKEKDAEREKEKGNKWFKQGEYQKALRFYESALKLSPYNVAILANISMTFLKMVPPDLDEAIEFCNRVLFLDPNVSRYFLSLFFLLSPSL